MSELFNVNGVIAMGCGPSTETCKCRCPDGPCEHIWDGPTYESEARGVSSATCSRCGFTAIDHDMWVGP